MSSVRWHFGFPDSLCFARWICTALSALFASVYGREESRRSLPKRFMPLHSTVLLWDNLAQDGPSCKQGQDSKNDQQGKLSWTSSSFQVGRSCLHQSLCFSLRLLLAFQPQITTRQLACLQSCIQWMLEVGLVKRMSALMLTQTSWQTWFNLLEKEMRHCFQVRFALSQKAIVKVINPKPVEAWNECNVPYLSELILGTSYFQNHFGHFISKKWLVLLSKFRWSAFISPIWAGKWFWGVATGQFLYSWVAFFIYLPFDFDGA